MRRAIVLLACVLCAEMAYADNPASTPSRDPKVALPALDYWAAHHALSENTISSIEKILGGAGMSWGDNRPDHPWTNASFDLTDGTFVTARWTDHSFSVDLSRQGKILRTIYSSGG